jgi:hypothetical protein
VAVAEGGGDIGGQPLVDVAGEGGSPRRCGGRRFRALMAGVDLLAVIDQHLAVVGDEDLLAPSLVEDLGGLGSGRSGPVRISASAASVLRKRT